MSKSLSNYFTWEEVIHSNTAERKGFDNSLPPNLVSNVLYAASKMDYVRTILATPILVDDWYRCLDLNRFLGSKDNSDHCIGTAIDFISPHFGSPLAICKYLLQYKDSVNWKQLILEYTWVHISFEVSTEIPAKKEVLTLLSNGGYARGLTDRFGEPV